MSKQEEILQGLVALIAEAVAVRLQNGHQRLLSVAEAAKYIGRSPSAMRHMIAKGAIPRVRRDGRVQIDRQDLA